MKKFVFIKATSNLLFTQKILNYQFIYSYKNDIVIKNNHYIILRHISSHKSIHNSKVNKTLCYTFSQSELRQLDNPYEYLARTILNLPYKFKYAINYTDEYGKEFILLHN